MRYVLDKQLSEQLARLQPQLASFPDFKPGDPFGWRKRANALYDLVNQQFPFQDGVITSDFSIPYGNGHLMARRYSPGIASSQGAVLYVHGGGGVAGSVELYDNIVRTYACQSGVDFI